MFYKYIYSLLEIDHKGVDGAARYRIVLVFYYGPCFIDYRCGIVSTLNLVAALIQQLEWFGRKRHEK
jgi:hypothetical protein